MNKKLVSVLAVGAILVAGWVGASAYVGYKAQQELALITSPTMGATLHRFSDVTHHRGLLTSSGSMVLHYPDPDAAQQPPPDLFQLQINYTIDHRVTLTHLSTSALTANLVGEGAQVVLALFGQNPTLTGQGRSGWNGQSSGHYAFPALKTEQADFSFELAPVSGQFKLIQNALDVSLNLPLMVVADADGVTRFTDAQLTLMTEDRYTSEGRTVLTIGQVEFPDGQAQKIEFVGESAYAGDRLNVSFGKAIGQLTVAGTTVSDVKLDFMFDGLYAKSIDNLSAILNTAGNIESLTPAQRQLVLAAVRDLVMQGFSVGMTQMQASTQEGVATAKAMLRVKPIEGASTSPQFDAAKQLVFNAELDLEGSDISPPLTILGTMMGVIVERSNGFTGSVSLNQGKLLVNGNELPFDEEISQISIFVTELLKTP